MRCVVNPVLALIVTIFSAGIPTFAVAQGDISEYKTTLLELLDTAGEILYTIDSASAEVIAESVEALDQIPDDDLRTVFMENVPLEDLQGYLQDLSPHLSAVRQADQRDSIDIPDVEVVPSVCAESNPATVLAATTIATIFEVILATGKFVCLQSQAGVNLALACVAVDTIRATFTNVSIGENFCLAQQHFAREKAMLTLSRSVGARLNTFIDDTTLSSRASQSSLDVAQDNLDEIQDQTQEIQTALDSGYAQLDSQASELMDDVDTLGSDLNQLGSILNDINFRSTVNLAFLMDASIRVADLQQQGQDIQGDVEIIEALISDTYAQSSQLETTLENEWSRQQRDRIAADLGNTLANEPNHALPSSQGGSLELVREIVINAILGYQALGSVSTSEALAFVDNADKSFNQGQYLTAYQQFKLAYQSLDGLIEGRR